MMSDRPSLDVNGPLDIDGWPVHLGQFKEGDKCYNQERNSFIVPCRNCRQMKWCLPTVTEQEQLVPPDPTNLLFYREYFDFFTANNGDVYDPCRRCRLILERDKDFSVKYGTITPTVKDKVGYRVHHQNWNPATRNLFFPLPIDGMPASRFPVRTANCYGCGASASAWNRCRPCGGFLRIFFCTRDRYTFINAHVVAYLTGEVTEPEQELRIEEYGDRITRKVKKLTLRWISNCRIRNNKEPLNAEMLAVVNMLMDFEPK